MGCGAGLLPFLGLCCYSGSKDVLATAVRLKAGKLPCCQGRFKGLKTVMLKKIPPLMAGDVGEKFCFGGDAVGTGMLGWQPQWEMALPALAMVVEGKPVTQK